MTDCRLATTNNRSVVGIMNEFTRLAEVHGASRREPDLISLTLRLAGTPRGPLYSRHISPDRQLAALITRHAP